MRLSSRKRKEKEWRKKKDPKDISGTPYHQAYQHAQ